MTRTARYSNPLDALGTHSPSVLLCGHVVDWLKRLPAGSISQALTSPPYYALRNYAAGTDEIGNEKTPEQYLDRLYRVFEELHRVLRPDGTFWLNLGDTYDKGGELLGIPWRAAQAARVAGFRLRSEIIWHKPNVMPETDPTRPAREHETIFVLAKSKTYFYDWYAVRQEGKEETGKNCRTVWTINTQGYKGAHFATWPESLAERMILAGSSVGGHCVYCGTTYVRRTDSERIATRPGRETKVKEGETSHGNRDTRRHITRYTDLGFAQGCECEGGASRPAIVLDPFAGSGTTLAVANRLGRHAVGIELSPEYCKLARSRVSAALTKAGIPHTGPAIVPVTHTEEG